MFLITRLSRHKQPFSSTPLPLQRHSTSSSSKLHDYYSFKPPPSLSPQNPQNPNPNPSNFGNRKKKKKKKPPYCPPSSLDRTAVKTIHSDLPFDFRHSYTESSSAVRPIGLREPKYSPFGPDRLDRVWTGVSAPVIDPKVESLDGVEDPKLEEKRRMMREKIQGAPLTGAERKILVDRCHGKKTKRQINLGRDGLTHNMLNDIHNHWRHDEAVRIRCMGVPTVDMKNVCTQLEEKSPFWSSNFYPRCTQLIELKFLPITFELFKKDKTFGKIIQRHGGTIVLYRGRNYNQKKRPVIPLMLWKPHEPVYPKLIKTTIDGLSIEETKQMRKRGLAVPALTKLAKNGYYGNLVPMVRDAFLVNELVRIDCQGLERKDYKKIGCKLRELVPCILVTFDKEQIVVWRGVDYKPPEDEHLFGDRENFDDTESNSNCSGENHSW